MSKRPRKASRPHVYDYTLGAFEIPDAKTTASFASSLLPRALAIGALGVGVWYFFFSSKAAARENAKNAAIPTGSATGASVTSEAGAPASTFVDPGSNVAIAGPSGTVMVSNGTYIVKRDESWSNIASRVYGDYRWWPALWDANRKLGRFGNPGIIAVGDVIVVPRLPVQSSRFKKLVFDRAEIDRAWELKKLKKGEKVAGPRPKDVFTATEVTAVDIAADAKSAAAVDVVAVVKEPVALPENAGTGASAPPREVDYVTSGEMSAEPEGGYEDLS